MPYPPQAIWMAQLCACALLALGLGAGLLDLPLDVRLMHQALAVSFVVLCVLMLRVQLQRFHTKGPGDWVAWLHFVIFAFLLFLAVRMVRRWWRKKTLALRRTLEERGDTHHAPQLIVFFRGQKYDATDYANNHPGDKVIWEAQGRDLEEVWREKGLQWHVASSRVQAALQSMRKLPQ